MFSATSVGDRADVSRDRGAGRVRQTRRYRTELRSLGLRIRVLRHGRSMTLELAAEAMDVDVTHLAKIEAGIINLTFATLVRIARGLGVTMADLFR